MINSLILMTCMFNQVVQLWGEIRHWSLLGLKGSSFASMLCFMRGRRAPGAASAKLILYPRALPFCAWLMAGWVLRSQAKGSGVGWEWCKALLKTLVSAFLTNQVSQTKRHLLSLKFSSCACVWSFTRWFPIPTNWWVSNRKRTEYWPSF